MGMSSLKIISGGQTGVDLIGLEVAKELDLETGGYAPSGFITTSGPTPELETKYGLVELPPSKTIAQDYIIRTMKNVDASDLTIVFRLFSSPGTDKTIYYCKHGDWPWKVNLEKPCPNPYRNVIIIGPIFNYEQTVVHVSDVIKKFKPKTINIAGHRNFEGRQMQEFFDTVRRILREVLRPYSPHYTSPSSTLSSTTSSTTSCSTSQP